MAAKKKNIISKASPHTIKKFELIEEYIKSWAQKLLLTESCNGLIFIDCMCNSGVYTDDAGQLVKGTAVRVSEALREASRTYTEKNIHIYLNDKDKARVDELKKHLPQDERNFKIVTSCGDAHELLRTIGPQLYGTGHLHYFLLYDPYDATIDWEALLPFFRNWGEVTKPVPSAKLSAIIWIPSSCWRRKQIKSKLGWRRCDEKRKDKSLYLYSRVYCHAD